MCFFGRSNDVEPRPPRRPRQTPADAVRTWRARHPMGTVTEMLNVGLDPRAMDRELGLGHSAIVWAQSGVDARHLNTTGWRALRSIFHNPDDWRSVFGVTRLVDLVQNGQAISDWGYDLATLKHYGYLETDKLLLARP
jgi:hypothetical protein